MKKPIILLVIFMFTLACGNSEKSSTEKKEQSSVKGIGLSPCELLTEAEIKSALSIPAETVTSMNEKNTTYPSCFYKWKSITWPVKSMGDLSFDYPAEMSIVLLTNANKEMYEASIKFYKDGQIENGVGKMATWSEKSTQLTFLAKGKLIHVHSRTSADGVANKIKTIKIAKMIVEKL